MHGYFRPKQKALRFAQIAYGDVSGQSLQRSGLGWVNFQVLRRSCSSLMNDQGTDGVTVFRGDRKRLILWSGVRDSNPCKSAWKADAQPLGQPRGQNSDRTYSSNVVRLAHLLLCAS